MDFLHALGKNKKILICPLNWGMGHATRCIPIATHLIAKGHTVAFASDGAPLELLKKEFPQLQHFNLASYKISYPTKNIIINVGRKIGSFIKAVRIEHQQVENIVNTEQFDIVISDNRFGCHAKKSYNIFITHQINLLSSSGLLDPTIRRLNQSFINKFDECWIPDFPEFPGLSGILGHQHRGIINYQYIGPITRMQNFDLPIKYEVTAILSGPEPQRSIFEKEVLKELNSIQAPTAMVSGVISDQAPDYTTSTMDHFSYLTSQKINELICSSKYILFRGGYTSVMDLAKLGKKGICVPTPGQTEQEYLTKIYEENHYFPRYEQGKLNLKEALQKIDQYTGIPFENQDNAKIQSLIY